MDPQNAPQIFDNWSPAAVLALMTSIAAILGGAVTWLANDGFKRAMEWREFKLKEKERLAALPVPAKEKFSTEQVFEDTELATGYKLMLYQQDKRIRELETISMDFQSRWQKASQDTVVAATRADYLEKQLAEEKVECGQRIERLEKQIQSMYRQMQKRGLTNGEELPPTETKL